MVEQIRLYSFVKSIFDGYREAKSYNYNPFNELENSCKLLEVDELNNLYNHAKTKEHHEMILDHMYKFNAIDSEYGYFKRLEKKIIHRYWEG